MLPIFGFAVFIFLIISASLWIARRKNKQQRVLWRNLTAASFVALVILLAIDGAFSEPPAQETTNETTEQQSVTASVVETPDPDAAHKQTISQLLDELSAKYEEQKQSYNEVEWAAFLRDFRSRHKTEMDKMTNASIKIKTAMADLSVLTDEMTADLQGRNADIEFFKNSIQEAIKE